MIGRYAWIVMESLVNLLWIFFLHEPKQTTEWKFADQLVSFNFPLRKYFFCNSPAPYKFSNGPTLSVLRCKSLLYVRTASRTYSNLICGACGASNAECIAIIEKMSWVTWYAPDLLVTWVCRAITKHRPYHANDKSKVFCIYVRWSLFDPQNWRMKIRVFPHHL